MSGVLERVQQIGVQGFLQHTLYHILSLTEGSRFFLGFFWFFRGYFFGFYVRGFCKNCKSHKDETNAEAAIGLFGYFLVLPPESLKDPNALKP